MTPQSHKVLDIMIRDGGITHLSATHYNIGCVRKEVSRVRAYGAKVKTITRKDAAGNRYSRWTLASIKEQPARVQVRMQAASK